jgi:serine/threonine protein kinase
VVRLGDGKHLALKYCHLAGSELRRFAREVRIMEQVRHPNVVPIEASCLEHRPPYFVMPLAERSLDDDLPRVQGNESDALRILRQVCRGVQALHASGIIHRDLKPANVLRFAGGRTAVSDFGLAKLGSRDTTVLTRTYEFRGTLAYSAPEQLLPAGTREADVRTDICQLGKMLYHMLTGKSPVLIDPDALPTGLAHVVQRATSVRPEDRYRNLGEFLDALRYYQLAKDPATNTREALENLVQQAEDLLGRHEYQAENIKKILVLLLNVRGREPGAVIEHVDRIPDALLPIMASEFSGELLPILTMFADALSIKVAGYNFSYAERVARRMKAVFRAARLSEVKTVALQATLIAAVRLHRFAAMNVFNGLLMQVQTIGHALPIAEMLREHADAYQKVADQVPPDRLHPAIRDVQCGLLDELEASTQATGAVRAVPAR